ncbi:MAG: SIMPL domain-containing protein [Candidatus Liptonbacteria bacterium]|nr:SIMPL domain-containing protein [Candidatus Liptonbacteria bacterium]
MDKSKKYFWVFLDILLAGLVINLFFFVMPTLDKIGNSQQATRTISVNAEGKTTVKPDLAQFSFSLLTEGADLAKISKENNDHLSEVIKFIKSQGVPDNGIETTQYNLQPKYQYDKNGSQSFIVGYTLTQGVFVKIKELDKNLDQVSKILGSLPELGVNNISGVSFTVEDPDKFMNDARAKAYTKARAQAEFMAKASGASLGRVVSVTENSNRPIPYYGEFAKAGMSMGMAPSASPAPLEPGTEDITLQVNVTYELR